MKTDKFEVPIECRASDYDGPGRLVGTILEVGRVASDRAEVFTAGAPIFPATASNCYAGIAASRSCIFSPSSPGVRSESTHRYLIPNLVDLSHAKSEAARGPRSLSNSYH